MASFPSIPQSEFSQRRRRLLKTLRDSIGVVFAGEGDHHLDSAYRPHAHFEYLTGIADEPGAILLLDPTNPVEARRSMVFLKPIDPEVDQWNGLRLPVGQALRERLGIQTVYRTTHFPRYLAEASRRAKRFACLHPLAMHTAPVSPDLDLFRKVVERTPGSVIVDQSQALPDMRSVKSKTELGMIQRAVDITTIGFKAALQFIRPGISEFDVQESIEHTYRTHGARRLAFGTIAGSGLNSTVLHYRANSRQLLAGDLLCLDSGAAFGSYSADITRTIPVSGKFTKRQRELYDIVLQANLAAVKASRPGATLMEVDAVARKVIRKAGYGDAFIHSIGHHLGIETHDASPDAPLREGAVITIEPGIYLPGEQIGIRIEDDVVVRKSGAKVLSSAIPRTADEIERAMRRPK